MNAEEQLDELLRLAARCPVEEVPHDEDALLAATAIEHAALPKAQRSSRWLAWAAAAVLGLGVVGGAFWESEDTPIPRVAKNEAPAMDVAQEPNPSPPSNVRLETGDRLVGAAGSVYDVVSTGMDRRVALHAGDVTFDVASIDGASFSVEVGDAEVRVLGTVFSVRRNGSDMAVRVFEGHVAVVLNGEERHLRAGETWSSQAHLVDEEWTRATSAVWEEIEPTRRVDVEAPTPRVAPTSSLDSVRALVRAGEFESALEEVDAALSRGGGAEWELLRADTLRGLRRWEDAARAYEEASSSLAPAQGAQAGYAAARIHADRLGDPVSALRVLSESGAAGRRSPLEERGRQLEIELLERSGAVGARDAAIEAYLERFPNTPTAREYSR